MFFNHKKESPEIVYDTPVTGVSSDSLKRKRIAWVRRIVGCVVVCASLSLAGGYLLSDPTLDEQGIPKRPAAAPEQKLEFTLTGKEIKTKIEAVEKVLENNAPSGQTAVPGAGTNLKAPVTEDKLEPTKPVEKQPQKNQEAPVQPKQALRLAPHFFIQVLATASEKGARDAASVYTGQGLPLYLQKIPRKTTPLWRVRLGPFSDKASAQAALRKVDPRGANKLKIVYAANPISAADKISVNELSSQTKVNKAAQTSAKNRQTVQPKPKTAKTRVKTSTPEASHDKVAPSPAEDIVAGEIRKIRAQQSAQEDIVAREIAKSRGRPAAK